MCILNGKALVTGASRGIGKAIALRLGTAGVSVCVNYHTSEHRASAVVRDIESRGGKAVAHRADVSDPQAVADMFDAIKGVFGGLDFLINNAGIDEPSPLQCYEPETWKRILDVNLVGKFLVTKHAVPLLRESPRTSQLVWRESP